MARFSVIFVERGLTLDGNSTWLLARRVGMQRAKHLSYTGTFLNAHKARDLGLVLSVHPNASPI